jgi:ABC-type transporter Mla maintaining outer membrane lipid asymmetry ATPase subunit MlaF
MVAPIMSDHLSDQMLRLMKTLGLTSIVVTHDLDLIYEVAVPFDFTLANSALVRAAAA